MKKIPITLIFWFGCFVILGASILQVDFPWFLGLGPIVIVFALGLCIWQWYRKVHQLKGFIAQEKSMLQAADHYIRARFPRG
jgi:hypothetical protein